MSVTNRDLFFFSSWKTVYRSMVRRVPLLLIVLLLLLLLLPPVSHAFVVPGGSSRIRTSSSTALYDADEQQQPQPPNRRVAAASSSSSFSFWKKDSSSRKYSEQRAADESSSSSSTFRNANGKINKKNSFVFNNNNGVQQQPQQRSNGTTTVMDHNTAAAASSKRQEKTKTTTTTTMPTKATTIAADSDSDDNDDDTAPEVNHWTELMRQGWTCWTSTTKTTTAAAEEEEERHGRRRRHRRPSNSTATSTATSSSTTSTSTTTNSITTVAWDTTRGVLSEYDLQQIEHYWERILPSVNYLGTEQVSKIYRALCVAYRAHRGQMRKSGEPFIIHPVEVALLLSNLKMDGETVMAGLLHDTVEDTDLTFGQVESLFGPTVRGIVEGETKVSKLPKLAFTDYADEQAENLRQMFVAMTDDYRIIIVKLADRLHNMRTLRHMKPEKQIKISRETLDIFAPLAHRMGIWQFKSELEDTAFMYLYPQEYKRLNRRLRQYQNKFRETLDKSQALLQKKLDSDPTLQQQAAKVEVFGRTKELYSLWHKMETKAEHNLNHIVDVVALRVIITPKQPRRRDDDNEEEDEERDNETDRGVWLCYHVLGLVQHLPGFQPVPTRVKDYISFPKPNGYQSLHTALNLNGQTIEVQIRTSMMHQVAEYGMASHWAYTDRKRRKASDKEEVYNTPWLSSIKEWQNDRISSRDFVDSVRRELLGKRVFVFLRNGKILNLARGATAIDAAFQIHTEVGLTMHGVEINGKPVPFSYELQNGDVVSILTGEGKPSTDWMRYAKSRSTRSKLRSYFRARQKESLREAGKIKLLDYLRMHGRLIEHASYLPEDFEVPRTAEDLAAFLPGRTRYNEVDELLVNIGQHHDRNMLHRVVAQLFEVPKKTLISAEQDRRSEFSSGAFDTMHRSRQHAKDASTNGKHEEASRRQSLTNSVKKALSSIDSPVEYADPEHLCEVCLPVHGDEIVGTHPPENDSITTVHRICCPHAQRAIHQAAADQRQKSLLESIKLNGTSILKSVPKVDSVSLRRRNASIWKRPKGSSALQYEAAATRKDLPVRLKWSDMDDSSTLFSTEVVVHAQDRKLLLADCSEVVSETAEIVKTGSSSNDEHATLVFLVKVNGLEHLQRLMDRLREIRSVMSVERRFGSELLL